MCVCVCVCVRVHVCVHVSVDHSLRIHQVSALEEDLSDVESEEEEEEEEDKKVRKGTPPYSCANLMHLPSAPPIVTPQVPEPRSRERGTEKLIPTDQEVRLNLEFIFIFALSL